MFSNFRWRRGASAVEFALVAPVLLALLLGGMDWTWYFFQEQRVIAASAAGARQGSRADVDADPVVAAEQAAESSLLGSGVVASALDLPAGAIRGTISDGDTIVMTIELPYEPLFGIVPIPDELHSRSTMRLENL